MPSPVISLAFMPKARLTMPPMVPPMAAPMGPPMAAPMTVPAVTAVLLLLPMAL